MIFTRGDYASVLPYFDLTIVDDEFEWQNTASGRRAERNHMRQA